MQALQVSLTGGVWEWSAPPSMVTHPSSYRCHKGCAVRAPHSCGLPPELMKFFRQQYLKKSSGSSFDAPNPTEPYSTRPPITRGHTYDADTRETKEMKEEFIIPELSKEPTKGQFQLQGK